MINRVDRDEERRRVWGASASMRSSLKSLLDKEYNHESEREKKRRRGKGKRENACWLVKWRKS